MKITNIEGRVVTVDDGKRFQVPFPHEVPKVGAEIKAEGLVAIGPKKVSKKQ